MLPLMAAGGMCEHAAGASGPAIFEGSGQQLQRLPLFRLLRRLNLLKTIARLEGGLSNT